MTTAMVNDTEPNIGGTVVPKLQTAAANRILMTNTWGRVREIFEIILAGAPVYTISSHLDLKQPDLKSTIDKYFRGTGLNVHERIKLFKMIWDAMYSEFAGRNAVYERNYAGNQDQQRLDALRWANMRGDTDRYKDVVQQSLDDYDLDGWKQGYLD